MCSVYAGGPDRLAQLTQMQNEVVGQLPPTCKHTHGACFRKEKIQDVHISLQILGLQMKNNQISEIISITQLLNKHVDIYR